MSKSASPASTVLNKSTWRTAQGEVLNPKTEMEESHVRNTLHYIYLKRAFFLTQSSPENIRKMSPDEFFEQVIKNSVLWNTLVEALEMPRDQEFIFYESLENLGDYHE